MHSKFSEEISNASISSFLKNDGIVKFVLLRIYWQGVLLSLRRQLSGISGQFKQVGEQVKEEQAFIDYSSAKYVL